MTSARLLSLAALLLWAAHAPAAAQDRAPAAAKAPVSAASPVAAPARAASSPPAPGSAASAAPRGVGSIALVRPNLRHRPRIVALPGLRPVVVPLGANSRDGYDERIKRCVHYGMAAGVPINEIARFTVQCIQ